MKIISIKIINPDTNAPVSLEDWKKEPDPTRAKWVLIETDELHPFVFYKRLVEGGRLFTFDEALQRGNMLTRARGLALYEARITADIDSILELINGDPIHRTMVWTCEANTDPRYTEEAWNLSLNFGVESAMPKDVKFYACLVYAFEP